VPSGTFFNYKFGYPFLLANTNPQHFCTKNPRAVVAGADRKLMEQELDFRSNNPKLTTCSNVHIRPNPERGQVPVARRPCRLRPEGILPALPIHESQALRGPLLLPEMQEKIQPDIMHLDASMPIAIP